MFEKIRHRLALAILPRSVKKDVRSPFEVLSTQTANQPVYGEMSVRKATREGYKISVYVYRSVRTIVQAASAIPWVVLDSKGEPIENHALVKVMRNPNPEFSGQDLIEFLIAHLELVGNALWQPIIIGKEVKELWPVMPDLVKPIPSNVRGEWLKGWQVTTSDGSRYTAPPEQFIHFMQMDPGNPYWGTSPLMAAARTVDTDNEAQDTQKVSMQNRGTPDGVFEAEAITTEQYDEADRRIKERYLTKEKRRLPWVVAGAKWHQMSLTPIEMDYIKSRLHNKRDIAGAFGISPIFLGDLEQSTYDNMMQARKALYEDVVIPLLDDVKATLNLKIAPMYGDIIIAYDTSKVAALREDYTKKVEQAKTLWGMGVPFDQINERLEMGFDEFIGWDRGYLPLTLLPTGASAPEAEPKGMMTKALNLETEEQKTAHWKRIDRRRVTWWGVVSKKVKPLYDDEIKAIEKAIKGKKPAQLISVAGRAIDGGRAEWEKMLTAISAALIEDFGDEIAEDLGGAAKYRVIICPKCGGEKLDTDGDGYSCVACGEKFKPAEAKWTFDPMSVAARAWIVKHGAESITTILATNLDDVKRVILAGTDENLSTVQIARNLRKFYTDRSPFKAMRVARTETASASGFGQREAAKQSGIVKTKQWLSSRDDRVRDSHAAIDGEVAPLDKAYSNGLMYPGDPSGPTEEFIMCRCVESYQTGG